MNKLVANNPRILLRQLHVVMAESGDPEALLARVVRLIATNMAAEVCSVYLMGADNVLELFATEGLNPAAVHSTRLAVGEGLTGEIAAHVPLHLSSSQWGPDQPGLYRAGRHGHRRGVRHRSPRPEGRHSG